ncbi:MAG: YraN family protein [SAR324 cluster bacterium]|nr:YraN family protein [SAR324 cluster bacterium]MBL7035738.1 YraN family protein [SAR324 cluster bacterium]
MTKARLQTGAIGEQIACDFMQEQGYRIVERNHRSRLGELDLIADYQEFLVFCEVKTRRGTKGPHPSLSVTAKKINKLRQLGEQYLIRMHLTHMQPRFDVIAVQLMDDNPPIIDHIINAF